MKPTPEEKPEVEDDTENPGTADHSNVFGFLFASIVSGAALLVLKGKKRNC